MRPGLRNQNSILDSCKKPQDSLGLWIPRRGFRIPVIGRGIPDSSNWIRDSLSMEFGFRIAIVRWIQDSLSCIPDSKAQDSRFHKQKFP